MYFSEQNNLLLHLQFCDQVINLEIRGNTCIALFISTGGLLSNLYICMHLQTCTCMSNW